MERSRAITRLAEPTDFYGVDLIVSFRVGGRRPEIVATLGANKIVEVMEIAMAARDAYPQVNRIEAFLATGTVTHAFVRDGAGWRRVDPHDEES
jgi:hypothetical protein